MSASDIVWYKVAGESQMPVPSSVCWYQTSRIANTHLYIGGVAAFYGATQRQYYHLRRAIQKVSTARRLAGA
eukprot:858377-Rhodomonas_salina.5